MTIPNLLTIARILMIPVIIWLFFMEGTWGATAAYACFGVYVLSALTDWLDGYLARKWDQITPFGTFLDPIADKILVGALLVLLIEFDRLPGLWAIAVIIIFTREFLVAGLREFLGPKNIQLPVTKLAKWKTAVQMIACGALILGPIMPYAMIGGQIGLAIAALLTAITGWIYIKGSLDHFK